MRILIAEDDAISRCVLETALRKSGNEVVVTYDGVAAVEVLSAADAPSIGVLDWMMPRMTGPEVCRVMRARPGGTAFYFLLLTTKGTKEDIITGLQAGADDFLTKPFDHGELQARLQVGQRILNLQHSLANRVVELEGALTRVKTLQGLLPICSYCKKVRDDKNYWQQVETYVCEHSQVRFSHGICPGCMETVVKRELEEFKAELASERRG